MTSPGTIVVGMRQLALELHGYPRPIAWTLSEVGRAVGHRDLNHMLLTAFEEITRYLVLVQMARYTEYWGDARGDADVEERLAELRRPSFGHYIAALQALDRYLSASDDPYGIGVSERRKSPAFLQLLRESGTPAKKASILTLLMKVVEIRNAKKGHGYTDQLEARALAEHLQPALIELVNQAPILLARPLVWIEQIEYLDSDRWIVTLMELMGTQRARRLNREVENPGGLRKGFLYMWDGDSAPLQLTPFLHFDQTPNDELVFVLSGLSGEPSYQARGIAKEKHRPDKLMSQFDERAPFLLKAHPAVTVPRIPDAPLFYRSAVEIALADGVVTRAEEAKLLAFRNQLGLAEGEATMIHGDVGWNGEVAVPPAVERSERAEKVVSPTRSPRQQRAAHELLRRVAGAVTDHSSAAPRRVALDDEIAVGEGELWVELGPTQGVALSVVSDGDAQLSIALGFYSRNERRDPVYRDARRILQESEALAFEGEWVPLSRESTVHELAWETQLAVAVDQWDESSVADVLRSATLLMFDAAAAALTEAQATRSGAETMGQPTIRVSPAPDTFDIPKLEGSPRIEGSVWKVRILWALEWARRHDGEPKSAAEIAKILSANGVVVPGTNTARAFRTPKDDPRVTGLVEALHGQRYVISEKGRRVLFEFFAAE